VLVDMVESTALRGRLGTAAFEELNAWHGAVLRAAVERHGGDVFKTTGDGLLASFVSAASAVEAAVDMQHAVSERPGAPPGGDDLAIRIGVSAGDVEWRGDEADGQALIEAARLEPLAGPGGIAVTEIVAVLARDRARAAFGPRETASAKGFSESIGFHRVQLGEAGSGAALLDLWDAGMGDAEVLGRTEELDELRRAWDGHDGRRIVIVRGNPGIGKTELCRAFGQRLHREGYWVLQGRCDHRELVPFQPFAEMLTFLSANLPDGPALLERWRDRLAPLLPDQRRGAGVPLDEAERFLLLEAVSDFFEVLSLGHPLLVLIDDLHAADSLTTEVIEHLLRRPGRGSMLIVGTARSSRTDHSAGYRSLRDALAGLPERATTLDLTGLGPAAIAELVARERGIVRQPMAGRIAAALAGYTGGNPLHLKAVLAGLPDHVLEQIGRGVGASSWTAAIDVPRAVIEDVERIRGRLDDRTTGLVEAAAVIGYRFGPTLVREVLHVDDATLGQAIDSALAHGLIVQLREQPAEFQFSHPLVRDAILETTGYRRRRLHVDTGRAILRTEPDAADRLARELSHHLAYSDDRGEQLEAARLAERAAEQAVASAAHDVAATQYRRALDLYGDDGIDRDHRFRLLLGLGRSQLHAGDRQATATLLAAARHAEEDGDGRRMADALLAGQSGLWSRIGDVDRERVRLIEHALALLPADDGARRAELLAAMAAELTFAPEEEVRAERDRIAERAIELAPEGGDPGTRFRVLQLRASLLMNPESLEERDALIAEMEQLADESSSPARRFTAASLGYWIALETPATELRRRRLATLVEIAEQVPHPRLACLSSHWRSVEAALAGELDAALEYAAETNHIMKALGERDAATWYIGARFLPYRALDRLDELVPDLETQLRDAPGWLTMRAGLALVHARAGRFEEAEAVLAGYPIDRLVDEATHHDRLANMALVAETLALLGDHPQRGPLCDEMTPWSHRVAFNGSACFGAVAHHRGLLLGALGRTDEAVAAFTTAVETNAALGAVALLAESRAELAGALVAMGEDRPAGHDVDALLREAATAAARLGLVPVQRRCAGISGSRSEAVSRAG
jgi:hypothetical protein